jgi:hypothetical protein
MSTTPAEAKPAWTRCPKCKQRLWNDRIDVEVHGQRCPADLERALKRLTKRVEELERRPVAHIIEPDVGPRLDLEHEAPWPDAPEDSGPEDDDEDDVPVEVPDVAPPPVRSAYFDDEDDEDDLDPTATRTFMR